MHCTLPPLFIFGSIDQLYNVALFERELCVSLRLKLEHNLGASSQLIRCCCCCCC
jgi:hypothetical protein